MIKYAKAAEAAVSTYQHLVDVARPLNELSGKAKVTFDNIERAGEVTPEWLEKKADEIRWLLPRLLLDIEDWKKGLRLEEKRQ